MARKSWDRPLDAAELDRLVTLTRQGWTIRQLVVELRRNHHVISRAQRRLGVANRPGQRLPPPDPTPQEIAERAAAERARWSQAERIKREVGRAADWRPTVVPVSILRSALIYEPG